MANSSSVDIEFDIADGENPETDIDDGENPETVATKTHPKLWPG